MKPAGPNSALISNTMLCEASRLLDSHDDRLIWEWDQKAAYRVADLLSLIEATSLHETLYTLPARLDSETENLRLRNELISRGIVKVLDTSEAHETLAQSIMLTLSKVKNPRRWADADNVDKTIDFEGRLQNEVASFLMLNKASESSLRLDEPFEYDDRGGAPEVDSLEDLGRHVIEGLDYGASGAYENSTSILRDMYYVLAAEEFELSYWPQWTRQKFSSQFPNYLNKTQLMELYSKLADAFKTKVNEVSRYHKGGVAFVPPFAALVLSRASKRQEITDRILEVRDEYAGLRDKLSDLDEERSAGTSMGELIDVVNRQKFLLEQLSSAFDRPSKVNLEAVIRYVPHVIKPAAAPADPTSYSAELLLLPVRQLITWWKRRPISKFFVLADKVKRAEHYPDLIQRLFGENTMTAYTTNLANNV